MAFLDPTPSDLLNESSAAVFVPVDEVLARMELVSTGDYSNPFANRASAHEMAEGSTTTWKFTPTGIAARS